MKMKALHPPRGWFSRFWLRLVRFLRRLIEGPPAPMVPPVPLRPPARPKRPRRPPPPCRYSPAQLESLGGKLKTFVPETQPEIPEEWPMGNARRPVREASRETLKMVAVPEDLRVLAATLVQNHFRQTGEAPAEIVIASETETSLPVLPHDLAPKTLIVSRNEIEQAVKERLAHKDETS